MHTTVAMKASRKDRPNTGAYCSMEEKFSSVKLPSRVVTAYTTTRISGATTKMAIHTT